MLATAIESFTDTGRPSMASLAGAQPLVGGICLGERSSGIHVDDGIDHGIDLRDALEARLHELVRGDLTGGECGDVVAGRWRPRSSRHRLSARP